MIAAYGMRWPVQVAADLFGRTPSSEGFRALARAFERDKPTYQDPLVTRYWDAVAAQYAHRIGRNSR